MAVGQLGGPEFLFVVGLLLVFVAGIPFWLQGLSVGAYFIERVTEHRIFKMLAVFMVFLSPLFLQIVLLIGILDVWFDYRGLIEEN